MSKGQFDSQQIEPRMPGANFMSGTVNLRAVFLLREVEQLSYYEIALALDIAVGTIASRLNRARRFLREWISLRS